MKKELIAVVISCVLAIPAYAIGGTVTQQGGAPQEQVQQGGQGQGPDIEKKKAEILQNIDGRISRLQSMKSCVQAAKVHGDLKACHEKYGPNNNGHGNGPGNRNNHQGGNQ
ncbi:MAG: hypothetical protein HQK99_01440 [Nitrospirae bacterium]|nr:hypothetical protein [Nitrospirota bacterium]